MGRESDWGSSESHCTVNEVLVNEVYPYVRHSFICLFIQSMNLSMDISSSSQYVLHVVFTLYVSMIFHSKLDLFFIVIPFITKNENGIKKIYKKIYKYKYKYKYK